MMNRTIYALLCLLFFCRLNAQEIRFSQFFNSPLYLCPSNAGSFDGTRIAANYRDQWPGISNTYITYLFSADHYFAKQNSGVGFYASRDQSGDLSMRSTKLAGIYSYDFRLFNDLHIRPGLQVSYSINGIDYSNLRLREQLVLGTPVPNTFPDFNAFNYYDAAASFLIYTKKYRIGFKSDHLARPLQIENSVNRIPMYFSVFCALNFWIKDRILNGINQKLMPAINLSFSGKYRQLDIGVLAIREDIQFGLWYRGIPAYDSYMGSDALIVYFGYTYNNLTLGLSHDFTISGLSQNANGANEVSLILLFESHSKIKKRMKPIKCKETKQKES